MTSNSLPRTKLGLAAALVVLIAAGGLWLAKHIGPQGRRAPALRAAKHAPDPLLPAVDAYNSGRYKEAEEAALRVIDAAAARRDARHRKDAVRARYVLAYAAARRKDMRLARDRFASLRKEVAKLPDKGREEWQPGVAPTTLEEEGAYQHAVCTAALGDKKGAEAEYLKFLHDYPESPLTGAAARRIEKLHGGHLPAQAETAWKETNRVAMVRREAREKAEEERLSLCGPECLAELLRRQGQKAEVSSLAKEMKTTRRGTSMLALVGAATKHGLLAKGLALTQKGLLSQPTPLIALISPGHYVVVDSATSEAVSIWDPSGSGPGKPSTRRYTPTEWTRTWAGIALVLKAKRAG